MVAVNLHPWYAILDVDLITHLMDKFSQGMCVKIICFLIQHSDNILSAHLNPTEVFSVCNSLIIEEKSKLQKTFLDDLFNDLDNILKLARYRELISPSELLSNLMKLKISPVGVLAFHNIARICLEENDDALLSYLVNIGLFDYFIHSVDLPLPKSFVRRLKFDEIANIIVDILISSPQYLPIYENVGINSTRLQESVKKKYLKKTLKYQSLIQER